MAQSGPHLAEIASIADGRDITRGFVNGLLSPEDRVLREQLHGDWTHYERLARDDQVHSTLQQRFSAVCQAEMLVEPGDDSAAAGEAAVMLEENLRRLQWDDICRQMLYGVFYGFAVGECMWRKHGNEIQLADVLVRKQRRFRFDADKRLRLLVRGKPDGEVMPDRKFWRFNAGASNSDDPYGLGLAHFLYWPVFFKRQDLRFWLIYLEKFAQPTAAAKVDPGRLDDEPYRAKVLEMLHSLQADAAVLIPNGVELELIEAARSGTADYAKMLEIMDAGIAKIVLSQTMTTDNGSSLAQAKVHADVADDVKKYDADLLCGSFNRQVAHWLTCWHFGEDDDGQPMVAPPRVWRQVEPAEDLESRAERDTKIHGLGYDPTEQYIADTYGEGWTKRETPAPLLGDMPGGEQAALDLAELALGSGHRSDQAALALAARELSNRYPDVLGQRVLELAAMAEQTGDFETFKERLAELAEEGPKPQTVAALQRPGVVARLMGMLRAQR